jgi:hypothetical protein
MAPHGMQQQEDRRLDVCPVGKAETAVGQRKRGNGDKREQVFQQPSGSITWMDGQHGPYGGKYEQAQRRGSIPVPGARR